MPEAAASTDAYGDIPLRTLAEAVGVDSIKVPECIKCIWEGGSLLDEGACREDVKLLALYFNSLPTSLPTTIGILTAWKQGAQNVSSLADAIVRETIAQTYASQDEFTCEMALKSATISKEKHCDRNHCGWEDEVTGKMCRKTLTGGADERQSFFWHRRFLHYTDRQERKCLIRICTSAGSNGIVQ